MLCCDDGVASFPGRIESIYSSVHLKANKLHQSILVANFDEMSKASRVISDRMHQLSGHCNINLVNDALRYWQNALKEVGSSELNAVSDRAMAALVG